VIERARIDAAALKSGGIDGVIIENFGDSPFSAGPVAPATVAFMTRIALAVREQLGHLPIGINVLRNDAVAAIAIAAATEAAFIRVNVHTGVMVTDQGVIAGNARETLLNIKQYDLMTHIAADVHVKHANPLANAPFLQSAKDTFSRGHANALIVTGSGTGQPVDPNQLRMLLQELPQAPIWIGSGLTPDNARTYQDLYHTAIVGTWLHEDSDIRRPVDESRVRLMRQSLNP